MRHEFALRPGQTSNNPSNVVFADSGNLDAFSRVRVSNPQTQFETQCTYSIDSTKLSATAANDGVVPAHSATTRMVTLQIAAGAAANNESLLQSYEYIPYQPGKSQLVAMTGLMAAGVAGAIKDFGYGDDDNGIFYRQNGTGGLQFVRRTSTSGAAVDNAVDQTNWNLDRLDGTGASGITLDPGRVFILLIDLQFLGMGRVRIGFDIDGVVIYAHEFLNANVLTLPYMQTATLPIRAQITAAAALAAPATCYFKCAAVMSEGGFDLGSGFDFAASGSQTGINNTTWWGVAHIRPTLTYPTAGALANRLLIVPESFELLVSGNTIAYELWVGVDFTGAGSVAPTWSNANTTYSGVRIGTGGMYNGNPITSGIRVFGGFVAAGGGSRTIHAEDIGINYPLTLDRAGASQRALGTLSIMAQAISAVNAAVSAYINWREIR